MASYATSNNINDSQESYSRDEEQIGQPQQAQPPPREQQTQNGGHVGALPSRFDAVQQRFTETKRRLTQSVQELDLPQRVTESKKQISDQVQKLEIDQKLNHYYSKEKIQSMKLEQRFGKAKKGIAGATTRIAETLQKINLARLIDNMEHDQEVADALERKNRDIREEQEAREMMRAAGVACAEAIESHLETFLENDPHVTYEEWISDLHPENLHEGKLLEGMGKELDHRFYVAESDHRLLWNKNLGGIRQEVASRSQMWQQYPQQESGVDLLDQSFAPVESSFSNQNLLAADINDFFSVADGLTEVERDISTTRTDTDVTTDYSDLISSADLVGASKVKGGTQDDALLVDFRTSTRDEQLLDFFVTEKASIQGDEVPSEDLMWFQKP